MKKRRRKATVVPYVFNRGLRDMAGNKTIHEKALLYNKDDQSGHYTEISATTRQPVRSVQIFVGPSVEGADEEYVEIVSGKVSGRKPSFCR